MRTLALLLTLISSATYGQWYLGGTAGASFSNYKSKTQWKEVPNSGLFFGVTGFNQVNSNFGINVGMEYIQKGYYHKTCNTISDVLETDYFEIPVMLDYIFTIRSLQNFKWHVNGGLYTAYWLGAKYKMKGYDTSTEDFDFKKNNASRFDIGPNIGSRLEYLLKNGSLSFDIKYEIGLTDLQKKTTDATKNTNRTLVVGLSYRKLFVL